MKHLYRIFIDDKLITERAFPFSASDGDILLDPDPLMPTFGDGHSWVSAWHVDSYVLWSNPLPDNVVSSFSPGLRPGEFYAFDLNQYKKVTTNCFNRNIFSMAKGQKRRKKSKSRLPTLQGREWSAVLELELGAMFPDDEAPIYITPEIHSDPRGQRLLRRVKSCFAGNSSQHVAIADMPAKWFELRIGLDMEGFPECVWRVGETRRGLAVWFVSRPAFPLWLCGQHVDEVFGPLMPELNHPLD